jgi:hypothetical protein
VCVDGFDRCKNNSHTTLTHPQSHTHTHTLTHTHTRPTTHACQDIKRACVQRTLRDERGYVRGMGNSQPTLLVSCEDTREPNACFAHKRHVSTCIFPSLLHLRITPAPTQRLSFNRISDLLRSLKLIRSRLWVLRHVVRTTRVDVTGSHSLTGFESNSNLWELCNFCSGFPKFDRTQNITACTTITTTTAATTTSSSTRCGTVVFASCAHCPRAQVLEPWVTI